MKNILKKRIKFIVIVIGIFVAINIALSFAYIRGGSEGNESVSTVALTGGQILVRYSSVTGSISINNISPGYQGNKQFTITSDFGKNHEYYVDGIWYTVALKIEKNEFDNNSIQYSLSSDNSSDNDGITIPNIQNKGILQGANTVVLGSGRFDTHNKTHVYNLKISYPDTGKDQSHEIGCEFNAYIDFINTNLINLTYEFDYTGGEQQFIAQYPGYYKIETWGAQGGTGLQNGVVASKGGYGGYSNGTIYLAKNSLLYINVGGMGADGVLNVLNSTGGYNGGGLGHWDNNDNEASGGGGGATHLSTKSGLLESLENYKDTIIVVAGGGGGGIWSKNGGSGGGYKGNKPSTSNTVDGGTQTTGNSFGKGGEGVQLATSPGGGGGGGYYGGYGGNDNAVPGAGGSGYIGYSLLINKYMYCYNCETSDIESTKTYTTTCAKEIPTENCAKIGNGYVRITYLNT